MRTIEIISKTHGSLQISVDDEDYEYLSKYKWSIYKRGSTYYCVSSISGKHRQIHRFILEHHSNNLENMVVDHINGNGLDNRKENLRICTIAQNIMNSSKRKGVTYSKFKGVTWDKMDKTWIAYIMFNRKRIHIGCFKSEIEAACAYNVAAIKYFGEFAR